VLKVSSAYWALQRKGDTPSMDNLAFEPLDIQDWAPESGHRQDCREMFLTAADEGVCLGTRQYEQDPDWAKLHPQHTWPFEFGNFYYN